MGLSWADSCVLPLESIVDNIGAFAHFADSIGAVCDRWGLDH